MVLGTRSNGVVVLLPLPFARAVPAEPTSTYRSVPSFPRTIKPQRYSPDSILSAWLRDPRKLLVLRSAFIFAQLGRGPPPQLAAKRGNGS